jgi:hypothetical protein
MLKTEPTSGTFEQAGRGARVRWLDSGQVHHSYQMLCGPRSRKSTPITACCAFLARFPLLIPTDITFEGLITEREAAGL